MLVLAASRVSMGREFFLSLRVGTKGGAVVLDFGSGFLGDGRGLAVDSPSFILGSGGSALIKRTVSRKLLSGWSDSVSIVSTTLSVSGEYKIVPFASSAALGANSFRMRPSSISTRVFLACRNA